MQGVGQEALIGSECKGQKSRNRSVPKGWSHKCFRSYVVRELGLEVGHPKAPHASFEGAQSISHSAKQTPLASVLLFLALRKCPATNLCHTGVEELVKKTC